MRVPLIFQLQRLDRAGIDVWFNRGRWFWAQRCELQAYAPYALGVPVNPYPVHGPYASKAQCALDACNSLRSPA